MTTAEEIRAYAEDGLRRAREQHIRGTEAERDVAFGILAGVLESVLERLAPAPTENRSKSC